jgi:hypothetical protein
MCGEEGHHDHGQMVAHRSGTGTRVWTVNDLHTVARHVVASPEVRRSAVGFIGYGGTQRGDKVLIAVGRIVDDEVLDAIVGAFHDLGATVDVIVVDDEPDRKFETLDEIHHMMRREPSQVRLRRGDRAMWIELLAESRGYDLLIQGAGGPVPKSVGRYEAFPWSTKEHFLSEANTFPRDLHLLINEKTYSRITDNIGGRIQLTDPEGTDLSLTILEHPFFDGRHDYGLKPKWGHLMAHPPTPVGTDDDTAGVIAGTMSHYGRPFPRIEVEIDRARMVGIRGGGGYGDAWRELEEESAGTQYPCFPAPGLFWLWELAIGTNPKVSRPSKVEYLSSDGFEWERRRGGIIHCGIGTRWRSVEEDWAGEQGLLYGHMHVHLLFPTLLVETPDGREVPVIERGRLSAYDDPDVRDLAGQFGDPDELLTDDWIPDIPGISTEGSYEEYARDPEPWIYGDRRG